MTATTAAPTPAVSVVLPTHNRADLLKRSLGSVLGQTFRDLEVFVVDDASTEDIAAVVASFGDSRASVVRLDTRSGGGGARNAGIAAARGRIVAFQDSDDEWLPEYLEKQMAALEAAPQGVGVAYCGFWRHDGKSWRRYPKDWHSALEGDLMKELLQRNPITTAAAIVKTAILRDVGGFDPKMPRYQDWDLWIRVAQRCTYLFINEPLLRQYRQPDSISTDKEARLAARLRLLEKYGDDMRRHGVYGWQCMEVAILLDEAGRKGEARPLWRTAFREHPVRVLVHRSGLSRNVP